MTSALPTHASRSIIMLTSDRKLTFVSVVAIIFYYYEWILFTWVLSAGRAVKEIGFAVRENIANSKKGIKYEGMHMNTFTLVHQLIEHAALRSLDQFLSTALDKACAFLDSPIGFYHFVESDQETPSLQQWSARTLRSSAVPRARACITASIGPASGWTAYGRESR